MRKYFFGIAIVTLALIIACVKDLEDEGIYSETEITGTVIEQSTNATVSNIKVKVTDGEHVYTSYTTGSNGTFRLKVNFDQMNKNYYLLLDGSPNLPTKQEKLLGVGKKTYDYKYIILYNKNDNSITPKVTTGEVSNITANSAEVAGKVTSNGGYPLTSRGICYATHQSPTINDKRSPAGAEIGTFSCNLTGLQTNVTYYVRAYATNTIGTAYGAQKSFTPDGLPTVTTTTPTHSGTTVTSGGNITRDGGSAVTARGVCYGRTPYPDLTSAHNHTTDGSGTGSFSSTFVMATAGVYYVRAYATNANGTAYGEQKTVNHPYFDLPTFTIGERTYRVAPPANNTKNWTNANSYCNNLTLYGYTDWRLPTKDELLQMYRERSSIGGFNTDEWWSATSYNSSYHYYVDFYNGNASYHSSTYGGDNNLHYVRPIRVEN